MTDENKNIENKQEENLNKQEGNKILCKKLFGLNPTYCLILFPMILLLCFPLFNHTSKYKYGHFIKGINLKYSHYQGYNNVFKLDNNNIFILGENGVPSELYDIKTNTVKEILFPQNLFYWSDGILLKNNRLILTNAHIANQKEKSVPYGSIVIVNLNNMTIEKVIEKRINITKEPKRITTGYLLNDNKIFMYQYGEIEIIDINSGSSRIINDVKLPNGKIIPTKDNKILIFANSDKEGKNNLVYNCIYEFDILTKNIKKINEITPREYPLIKKISDNQIIIVGSRSPKENNKIIEIYDINENKSKIISNLILNRCTYENSLNVEKFDKNKLLITGGRCGMTLAFIPTSNSKNPMRQSEILDLENFENTLGPISKYCITGSSMIMLDNGDIFITNSKGNDISKEVQIFKKVKTK